MSSRDEAWNVIAEVRDRYPRQPDDAPTAEIVDALVAAGLLEAKPEGDQYDRDGDLWTEVSPGRWDCRYGATAALDWDVLGDKGSLWELVVKRFGPMRPAKGEES